MPSYFSKFPKINYKFPDGTEHELTDINIKFSLSSLVKTSRDTFYPFSYRDQDRPDILSDKYYDSSDFYWLVLMSNDIYDINTELPLSYSNFIEYLIRKYKDDAISHGFMQNKDAILTYCFGAIHHYEDSDGYVIDHDTFLSNGNTKSITIYDHEFKLNEQKRNIRLIQNSTKSLIKNELESKLRNIKSNMEL